MKTTRHIKNRLRDQGGQIAVEYILLMVILTGVFLAVRNTFISDNIMGNFVQRPWALVAGMIETGVWGEPQKVRSMHPGTLSRHNSFKGDAGDQ